MHTTGTCVWIVDCSDDSMRSNIRQIITSTIACALLVLWGCGGAREEPGEQRLAQSSEQPYGESPADAPESPAAIDSVTVVFTKEEAPAPVRRPVPESSSSPLRAALDWLVQGPTPAEQAAGIRSWFSEETADVLRSVELDSAGQAIVDFRDLRPLIPNASSSFGSTMLLQELNGTIFQFSEIDAVEYRMEGSCDLFWEWLQYGCQVVRRDSR